MEWVIVIMVVVVLGVLAVVATGRFGAMAETAQRDVYLPVLPDRELTADDIDTIRFGVTLRGYAMEQVDDLLDRVSTELTQRDVVIAQLREANEARLAEDETLVEDEALVEDETLPTEGETLTAEDEEVPEPADQPTESAP